MNNNERFNTLLNNCKHPWEVYNTLLALAKGGLNLRTVEVKERGDKKDEAV